MQKRTTNARISTLLCPRFSQHVSLLLPPHHYNTLQTKTQGLEKMEASGASGASSSPENAEILEKVEKVIATLEGGGEGAGEDEE